MNLSQAARNVLRRILREGEDAIITSITTVEDSATPWKGDSGNTSNRTSRVFPVWPDADEVKGTAVKSNRATLYTDDQKLIEKGDTVTLDNVVWRVEDNKAVKLRGKIIFQEVQVFK